MSSTKPFRLQGDTSNDIMTCDCVDSSIQPVGASAPVSWQLTSSVTGPGHPSCCSVSAMAFSMELVDHIGEFDGEYGWYTMHSNFQSLEH